MAQRRNLGAPRLNNTQSKSILTEPCQRTSSTSKTPTCRQHPTRRPDLGVPSCQTSSLVNHLSRLTLNDKARFSQKRTDHSKPQPPPHLIAPRFQAKTMPESAIFDSSKSSLSKPKPQKGEITTSIVDTKSVKESSKTNKSGKQTCKRTEFKRNLEAQKLQESKSNLKEDISGVILIDDRRRGSTLTCEEEEEEEVANIGNSQTNKFLHDREGIDCEKSYLSSLAVIGCRRESFYGSKNELRDVLASDGVKVVSADMPPFMQIHAADFARKTYDSMEKFTSKTLALALKKEFDGVYGPAWHCIVGTSFGSFVTHSVGGFLYFSMNHKLYILLFKTAVHRSD